MKHLTDKDLREYDWQFLFEMINIAANTEYVQPLKPYLRYRNPKNRIIAMPSFLGGIFNKAGIKWISSFPDNVDSGIPRAHCVFILNDADTGVPLCTIDTIELSVLRTAAVTGCCLKYLGESTGKIPTSAGIIGYGPIGRKHEEMLKFLFPEIKIKISDPRFENSVSWQDAYDSDIVITATANNDRYIDILPRPGQWIMNISLRDFKIDSKLVERVDHWIIDDWDEINRENTDIEQLNLVNDKIQKNHILLKNLRHSAFQPNDIIMFNPMGMSIFDLALATYFYENT